MSYIFHRSRDPSHVQLERFVNKIVLNIPQENVVVKTNIKMYREFWSDSVCNKLSLKGYTLVE